MRSDQLFIESNYEAGTGKTDETQIIAANNAKEAIMFYFTMYQDDINTDDVVEFEGIKIEEVDAIDRVANRPILNEENNTKELISYEALAKQHYKGNPVVLITPNY